MSTKKLILVCLLGATTLMQQSKADPSQPSGSLDIGSVPAALPGKPPIEPWLPRKLDAKQKANRAAADANLMRSERIIDDRTNILTKLVAEVHDQQYELVDKQLDAMLGKAVADPTYTLLERDLSDFTDEQCCITVSGVVSEEQAAAWVKARPDSAWAHFSHAVILNNLAWQARGEHFSDQVTDDQWKLMEKYNAEAREELLSALKLKPKMALAWTHLIEIDQNNGADDPQHDADFKNAQTQRPDSILIPELYMNGLEPRWGGDYTRMQQVAAEAARHVAANPRFWGLQGLVSADQGYAAVDEHCTPCDMQAWQESLKYYNDALGYEDRWTWLDRAGEAAIHLGHYGLAYKYFERALAYRPDHASFLAGARFMAEVCSAHPDLQKMENLRQTYIATSGADIDNLPRTAGDCGYYKAELPWGDEPLYKVTGDVRYEISDR